MSMKLHFTSCSTLQLCKRQQQGKSTFLNRGQNGCCSQQAMKDFDQLSLPPTGMVVMRQLVRRHILRCFVSVNPYHRWLHCTEDCSSQISYASIQLALKALKFLTTTCLEAWHGCAVGANLLCVCITKVRYSVFCIHFDTGTDGHLMISSDKIQLD